MYFVLYIEHYLQPASCHVVEYVLISVREYFWAYFVKILVFPNATNYMLTSFSFFFINLKYILKDSCKMISNEHDVLNLN